DEALGAILVLGAFGDGPKIEIVDLPVPDHAEPLTIADGGTEDAAAIARRHPHLLFEQPGDRFLRIVPPKDVALDLVENLEGAVGAFGRGKLGIDIRRLDPVGEERKLERVAGAVRQTALAGEALRVDQVGDLRWLSLGESLPVESDRRRPGDAADPAGGQPTRIEVEFRALSTRRGAEARGVDRLEQPVAA